MVQSYCSHPILHFAVHMIPMQKLWYLEGVAPKLPDSRNTILIVVNFCLGQNKWSISSKGRICFSKLFKYQVVCILKYQTICLPFFERNLVIWRKGLDGLGRHTDYCATDILSVYHVYLHTCERLAFIWCHRVLVLKVLIVVRPLLVSLSLVWLHVSWLLHSWICRLEVACVRFTSWKKCEEMRNIKIISEINYSSEVLVELVWLQLWW